MPVKPRIAATVILLRKRELNLDVNDTCEFEIFMAKRHANAKFMRDHHVFPGGGIEEQDTSNDARSRVVGLDESIISDLKKVWEKPSDLWIIAIRELFEETGILIASLISSELFKVEEKDKEKFKKYQKELQEDQITITDFFIRENLYFPANTLKHFGRLITPKSSPIRFDTQFFLCTLPQNQEINLFKDELTEGLWGTPKQLLELYRRKKIKLIFPQFSALDRLNNFITIEEAFNYS